MLFIEAVIALGFGHAIADLALQTEWIGKYKHYRTEFIYPDGKAYTIWPWVLLGHSMVNGAVVWIITGNIWLGVAETVCHLFIDFCSTMGVWRLTTDQLLHGLCKVGWAYIWVGYLS